MALDPPSATSDLSGEPYLDEDYLVLSTVHSAKGQEWEAVHIRNVADGNFPSEFSTGRPELVEEERRLLYVAMTRAKSELHLIAPLKYYVDPVAHGRPARVRREEPVHDAGRARLHGGRGFRRDRVARGDCGARASVRTSPRACAACGLKPRSR